MSPSSGEPSYAELAAWSAASGIAHPTRRRAIFCLGRLETTGAWRDYSEKKAALAVLPDLGLDPRTRRWRFRPLSRRLRDAILDAGLATLIQTDLVPNSYATGSLRAVGRLALRYGTTFDLSAFGVGPLAQFLRYAGKRPGWPAADWQAVADWVEQDLTELWRSGFAYLGPMSRPLDVSNEAQLTAWLAPHYGEKNMKQPEFAKSRVKAFRARYHHMIQGGFSL